MKMPNEKLRAKNFSVCLDDHIILYVRSGACSFLELWKFGWIRSPPVHIWNFLILLTLLCNFFTIQLFLGHWDLCRTFLLCLKLLFINFQIYQKITIFLKLWSSFFVAMHCNGKKFKFKNFHVWCLKLNFFGMKLFSRHPAHNQVRSHPRWKVPCLLPNQRMHLQ